MYVKTVGILTATLCGVFAAMLFGSPLARGAASAATSGSAGNDNSAAAGEINASNPYELVKSAANTLLQELDKHRAEYRSDPAKLRDLVDRVLLPHFDSEFAARLVLGRHWNMATPDQRKRFIDAFYNSLLRNYGNALLDFTADRLQVLPYRGKSDAQYATVVTRVRKSDGSTVQVNYSLRNENGQWKVWDVVVEGISYDKSFQQDFGAQIDRQGIEAVISRLQHGETPTAIKRTTGS
jgi:phospholipid transport system substrate-binding protein